MKQFGRVFITLAALVIGLAAGWLVYEAILASHESAGCLDFRSGEVIEMTGKGVDLQESLERTSAKYGGIGLQATVIFADGSQWSGAAGYADLKKRCPLTTQHHLYIGSMTKVFTSALILDQAEQGTLALDDSLGRWFADAAGREVSLRRLLNHTSGIPNYTKDALFAVRYILMPGKHWQPEDLYRVIGHKALQFQPGSKHDYSNSNYALLGMILEKASGFAYPSLLRTRILDPLGLTDTYCLDRPGGLLIANGYDESQLKLGRVNTTGLRVSLESGAYSAGCVLSTSQDVAEFTNALFGARVVGEDSLAEMTTFVSAPDEDKPWQSGYGLGVRRMELDGETFIGHTGTIPGFSGLAVYHPASGVTVVILSNLSSIDAVEVLGEIWAVVRE